jgi:integrase/recombinase XerC/integrase/recombinase XerD
MSRNAGDSANTNVRNEEGSSEQYDPRATAWVKPEQVEAMRSAAVANSATYLTARNDTILATLYDTGLRVGELVQLDVEMLDLNEGVIMLPADLQKDYPNDNTPVYTEIGLSPETVRVLRTYLAGRWKDSTAVFPSRSSDRMTTHAVRRMVKQAAIDAGIRPYTTGGRGRPEDVTPHTLRHSVAYRMLNREEGNTLYDVTKRLRHATILTTERVYSHFDRV